MTLNELKEVHDAQPFLPFSIQLPNGEQLEVPHPEFLLIHPTKPRTCVVARPAGGYRIVDLMLVVSLDVGNGKAPPRRGRKS